MPHYRLGVKQRGGLRLSITIILNFQAVVLKRVKARSALVNLIPLRNPAASVCCVRSWLKPTGPDVPAAVMCSHSSTSADIPKGRRATSA
jgi:hypothetical protein